MVRASNVVDKKKFGNLALTQTHTMNLALKLMNKSWYNPRAKKARQPRTIFDNGTTGSSEELRPPNLEKAWAYFEHFSLSRYISDDSALEQNGKKSEPGHNILKTK